MSQSYYVTYLLTILHVNNKKIKKRDPNLLCFVYGKHLLIEASNLKRHFTTKKRNKNI